jgi:Stigma-specific protein, Stig1
MKISHGFIAGWIAVSLAAAACSSTTPDTGASANDPSGSGGGPVASNDSLVASGGMTVGVSDNGIEDAASDPGAANDSGAASDSPGCASNAECASGVCKERECAGCQSDRECTGERACGTGTCAPRCASQAECANGFDCCSGHCVDVTRDTSHCGACPTVCDPSQFCGTSGCAVATIANLCGNAQTTLVQDGLVADDSANAILQGGLVASCAPAPVASSMAKGATGSINPTTGRPVAGGGNLLTVAGGAYVQKVVEYLDKGAVTPVYLFANAATKSWQYLRRGPGGGTLIAEMPYAQGNSNHDIVLIETVRDPASGTLVLIAFGQQAESTGAAAWYVANEMLPNRTSYNKSWYVFEWTGGGEAGAPGTYTLIAAGP